MKLSAAFMGDLQESKRPGILVGGGAYKAREKIREFAKKFGIPVFRTWNALDVVCDDSWGYAGTVGTYGGPGRNFGVQNCDLLLILGCRLSGRITGGMPETFARGAKAYRIDIEDGRDAGEFVDECLTRFSDWSLTFDEWRQQCYAWRFKYDPVKQEHIDQWHHYGVMRLLSQQLPRDSIITYDTGGNAIMMGHCFQSKEGQRIFSSNGNSAMGGALCYAIGAWFAEPSRPIICIIGDGGMQLNIQELQTIKHYGIPLKVLIFNNKVLGNTKAYQRVNNRPEIACGPDGYSSPDFVAVAQAYGLEADSVTNWATFGLIEHRLKLPHAFIFDIVDEDRCQYEPRISRWDTPIEDAYPFLPRDEFRANMIIEPSEGWEGVN